MENLILIGMPACGKTSVGVALARALGMTFVDTDRELEHADGRRLAAIVRQEGTAGFRALEERTLLAQGGSGRVIATGGSAVYSRAGMEHLRSLGTVIYLRLRYESVAKRLGNLQARGVSMAPGQTLRDLYEERTPLYERYAHWTVDADGLLPREIIERIRTRLAAGDGAPSHTEKRSNMSDLNIVCLDLEGVLVPEIWIAFSQASGIPELRRTTRDEPDYDKLMRWRLGILKEHGLGLRDIQAVIATIDPLPGAKAFLDELRATTQAVILSDTFTQFAKPLMEKLGWPTLLCNCLEVAPGGEITGYRIRTQQSKLSTVRALQSVGFDTIAAGDSYNDLAMIQASKAGFLFRSTEQIKRDHPEIPAFETFEELLGAIKAAL